MIIAIDGPAGAGKSTVARRLAERLGFRYLDTGAMYRALTWLALERDVDLDNGAELTALARENEVTVEEAGRVTVAGRDVSTAIRTVEIDRVVSSVARHHTVREVLRERQRALAAEGNAVMEGRDIGAVVCPGADVKVFLTAEAAERARRRTDERPGLGADALATDLRLRDARDAAQMEAAADAETIDTTDLTIDEVVDRIEALAATRTRG
ncbi:MAG: (d)CMP kinase [Actinobacteria bacterium]|nr:(d)CMP kinase [Actinomycetota bacterium]